MSLKSIDLTSAMRRLADMRIEEAMAAGKFRNLRGAGKDIDLDDMPADEDARMTWWCLRILRQNDFIPDEVRWRKQIDALKESLAACPDPAKSAMLVKAINDLVHRLNILGTNALPGNIAPVKP